MAGLSFLHSGHDAHTGNHGSTGEALGGFKATGHAHGHAGGHSGAHHGSAHHGGHHGAARTGARARLSKFRPWWAFSPFDIFAYATGAGAVGEILRQMEKAPNVVLVAAILGALGFNFGIAKPVLNGLLKFETPQSQGLEGAIAQEVEALTKFDAQGRGLVLLRLDGQVIQVLAILERDELDRGVTVAKGDHLWVVSIDAAKNTCRVTRELAS